MSFRKTKIIVLASMIVLASIIVLIFTLPFSNPIDLKTTDLEVTKGKNIDKPEITHIGNIGSIEKGQYLYGNTCLFCHGSKGVGSIAPSLVEGGFKPDGKYSDEYFIEAIRFGRAGTIMSSFDTTLTQTEIWQIVAYLRDQAKQVEQTKK
jgi:mono/diheme cytochrome c family protein